MLSNNLKAVRFSVRAGHSRPKDGVASARLSPAIHVFLAAPVFKTWMPGIADKFTQSAQGRLLWPGMTTLVASGLMQPDRILEHAWLHGIDLKEEANAHFSFRHR